MDAKMTMDKRDQFSGRKSPLGGFFLVIED
jgi:hypothetical protein